MAERSVPRGRRHIINNSQITVVGNLTADPELRFVGDSAKLTFSVACDRRWRDQAGEWQSQTSYFQVVAWRDVADNAARSLAKGLGVVVVGRLEQRSYDDTEGNKKYVTEIVADVIAVNTWHIGDDFVKHTPERKDNGASRAPVRSAAASKAAPSSKARAVPEEAAW